MREQLIDSLVQGDRTAWAALGVLWAAAAILVLLHRPDADGGRRGRAGAAFAFALLGVASATSIFGLPLAAALSVPRIRWEAVDAPALIAAAGGDTWRKLRGPAVVVPGPAPDLAVPTIDASGQWILVGLLSGKPLPGLPPAEASAPAPGAPRLCKSEGTECRAWPVAWPDPGRPPALGELMWARPARGIAARALAYDVETGLFLTRIEPAPGGQPGIAGPHFEMIGRPGSDPKLDGPSVVFLARSVAGGRLRAARVAAFPDASHPGGYAFRLHRASASLTAGPAVFAWIVRPLLAFTSAALPVGLTLFLASLRRGTTARVLPWLESAAAFAVGLAAAAPAVVALAGLWGSRS